MWTQTLQFSSPPPRKICKSCPGGPSRYPSMPFGSCHRSFCCFSTVLTHPKPMPSCLWEGTIQKRASFFEARKAGISQTPWSTRLESLALGPLAATPDEKDSRKAEDHGLSKVRFVLMQDGEYCVVRDNHNCPFDGACIPSPSSHDKVMRPLKKETFFLSFHTLTCAEHVFPARCTIEYSTTSAPHWNFW